MDGTGSQYDPYSMTHLYYWDEPRAEEVGVTYRAKQTSTGTVLPPETLTLKLVAIGGPLDLTAKPYSGNPPTFSNDHSNPAEPVYVQYFDYSHATPPSNASVQKTQDATANVHLSQPVGTVMTWHYGALYCPELAASPSANLASITLQAESAATSALPVSCTFTYTDPTDTMFTGSADDDTPSTPINDDVPSVMKVYRVSVHRPKSTKHFGSSPLDATQAGTTVGPGETFVGVKWRLRLYDHKKEPMPGVWIQERFTTLPAGISNFKVNGDGVIWTTQKPPTDEPTDWALDPSGGFEYDYLWIKYGSGFNGTSAVHEYWAATQLTSPTSVGGINVGSWTISYGTSTVTQSPTP